jgi:RimJ/RimL family protein N-acetyltransferase
VSLAYPDEWETTFTAKNGTISDETVSNLIPPFNRERIEGWTSNIYYDEVLAIVAVVEENRVPRIVGSASLKFNEQEVFKHRAELGICVHDDYQNIGIGTALLNHMLDIARKKKLKKVGLTVNATNDRAIRLYRKAGFEIEGTLRKEIYYKREFKDEHRMGIFF